MAAGLVTTAALATPATAARSAPAATGARAAACWVEAGASTAARDYLDRVVRSTSPITVEPDWITRQPYGDLVVRLNSDMVWSRDTAIETLTGSVVFGAALYDATIWVDRVSGNGTIKDKRLTRIGGGWDRFVTLTRSNVTAGHTGFDRAYALRSAGTSSR
jgi:hypothetical protein